MIPPLSSGTYNPPHTQIFTFFQKQIKNSTIAEKRTFFLKKSVHQRKSYIIFKIGVKIDPKIENIKNRDQNRPENLKISILGRF